MIKGDCKTHKDFLQFLEKTAKEMELTGKIYFGIRLMDGETQVSVWQQGSLSKPLKHIVKHSPTGFEWGYLGSGPADLALSILKDFTGSDVIPNYLYQQFKQKHVSTWKTSWIITEKEITKFLMENKER